MKNVVWDTHFYGWVPKYSTNMVTIVRALGAQISQMKTVQSADGIVPVIIGEFGPSTTGLGGIYDANGLQVVQAVGNSGYGTLAWAWNAGTDALTDGDNKLTDFGILTARHIATGH